MPLHFTQSCPTCGRRLQVHTRLLGQNIACQHCHAEFMAGSNDDLYRRKDSAPDLLARAEAMLKMTQPVDPPSPAAI